MSIQPLGIRLRTATRNDEDILVSLASQRSIYYDGSFDGAYAVDLASKLLNEEGACAFIMNDSVTEDNGGLPAIFMGYMQDKRFSQQTIMIPKGPYWRNQLFSNFPIDLSEFIRLSDCRLKMEFPNVVGIAADFNHGNDPICDILKKQGYRFMRFEEANKWVLFKNL